MKGVESQNSKASKLAIERLRQYDGLSNLSDQEAMQIIESLDQLSKILFCISIMSVTQPIDVSTHSGALKKQFLYLCETMAESGKINSVDLKKNLAELELKLEKLEDRFAFGEMDREIFERVGGKLKQEIKSLKDELSKSSFQLSNPSMLIDQSLEIISNLSEFWASGDYEHKRKLQLLLFPGGVLFDRQIDNYRTPNVNSILTLTRSLSDRISENKNGQIRNLSDLPGFVVPTGIEPVSKV